MSERINLAAGEPDAYLIHSMLTHDRSGGRSEKVLKNIVKYGPKMEPDSPVGGWGLIKQLDNLEIHDGRIAKLYEDVCQKDLIKTVACIRATTTIKDVGAYNRGDDSKVLSKDELNDAVDGKRNLDVDAIVDTVRKKNYGFDKFINDFAKELQNGVPVAPEKTVDAMFAEVSSDTLVLPANAAATTKLRLGQ